MHKTELEQAIRDYIKSFYKAEYVGLLEVNELNPGFSLVIGLPSYQMPTTISSDQESPEDFLEYIKSELRTRNYMRASYFKIVVGSTEVKNIENGLELNMATTTSACANGEDGYSDKPITVYFYDK